MRGLPQKQNARRAYKIRLCGHLRRYKKIVKKTYIIYKNFTILIYKISKIQKLFYLKAKAIVSNISFIGSFDNFLHFLPPH